MISHYFVAKSDFVTIIQVRYCERCWTGICLKRFCGFVLGRLAVTYTVVRDHIKFNSHGTLFIIISFKVMNSAAKNRFILKLGIQIYTKNEIN